MQKKKSRRSTPDFEETSYLDTPGYPSKERMKKGPVAIIECAEEIPCNPCETICPRKAITVGKPITNLPVLNQDKCSGCGKCIAICPGLAIFVLNLNYSAKECSLTVPYELLPVPEKGETVDSLTRNGEKVCEGKVVRVIGPEKNEMTSLVTFSFLKKFSGEVRNLRIIR